MKQSEQALVGLLLIVGGAVLVIMVGLPQWDAFNNNQSQVTTLQDEIKGLEAQKGSLTADIAEMEKNIAIPSDIEVQKYTEQNREKIIKGLLDKVVNLATGNGNLFISLEPSEAKEITPPPAGNKPAAASASANEQTEPEPPKPVLNTFDYEVAVRGTYGTIQAFLKAVAAQKVLLEIHTIKLENELGSTSSEVTTSDPFHPIRMTAQIRLALQPTDP